MKRLICCLLAASLLMLTAAASAWSGVTVAGETFNVEAPANGTLTGWTLTAGERIEAGQQLGTIPAVRTFSTVDGTVARVQFAQGDRVNGTVVEILPVNRFHVTCSVDGAWQVEDTTLVHSGESVWLRCSMGGSHHAVGRITSITGNNYEVEIEGGELIQGEAVRIYRDASCADNTRVGHGTVLKTDTIAFTADGYLSVLRVKEGDPVQRGQWLYSILSEADGAVTSPATGIVTAVTMTEGAAVQRHTALATAASCVEIELSVDAEDSASLTVGQKLRYTRADCEPDTHFTAVVKSISRTETDGKVTVTLTPDDKTLPIGLSIEADPE